MNTQEVEAELRAELDRLTAREDRIDAHQHNTEREVPKDRDEFATSRGNDEVVDRLEEHAKHMIALLTAALQRIENGTWGECVSCEKPIAEPRLRALPAAPTCLKCAKRLGQ